MWARIDDRRVMELGTPGAMRDKLNALVLAGNKTATAGLLTEDYAAEDELVEQVGEQLVLVDDQLRPLALLEVDQVDVLPFSAVPWDFAHAEGEGFTSIDDWRSGHLEFWQAAGARITDTTSVVCLRFHVVQPT
jgi:uncharacterized protein YhfF